MQLAAAQRLAARVQRLLAPACAETLVVGSVRRQRPEVKDIELAVVPRAAVAVFGEPLGAKNRLEQHLADLVRKRELLRCEPSRRVDGPRQKRYLLAEGIELELWIADISGANFGNICAIRTGDADFARLLVTKRRAGGLMHENMRQEDGYLWLLGERLACRTEERFFGHLGIAAGDVPAPERRDADCARQLRALVREGVRA